MGIKKIVFTGGPCAGKTTIINMIKEYLSSKYKVIVVSESATKMINSGINFSLFDNTFNFQDVILQKQVFMERLVDYSINISNKNDFIIIYDRGILDNKAYFNDTNAFDSLLNKYNYNELTFLDNYDLVIDLVTLAKTNPSLYNTSSNLARTESVSESIVLDDRTINAWVGHRNLKIIDTSKTIEEEFEEIKNIIEDTINSNYVEPNKVEIYNSIYDFNNYTDFNSRLISVKEGYLDNKNTDIKYKIVKRIYKGKANYILYSEGLNKSSNVILSIEEYIKLISKYKLKDIVSYKQLSFVYNSKYFNIKFYPENTVLEYDKNIKDFPYNIEFNLKNDEHSYIDSLLEKHKELVLK